MKGRTRPLEAARPALDDLLLVAAIAEQASLVRAAAALALSHPTAFRRLQALEARLGVRLFERSAGRYRATPAGEELARAGQALRAEADAALLKVQGRDLRPSGVVRLACTEGVLHHLLLPLLPALRQDLPEIHLHVSTRNEFHNLSAREADLALRAAGNPPAHLLGQRIGPLRHAVYAEQRMAKRFSGAPWPQQPWLALDDTAASSGALIWLARQLPLSEVALRFGNTEAVCQACLLGLGLAVLPCFIGDAQAQLVRMSEPLPDCDAELWLLCHPELRDTARVRAVRQWLFERLGEQAQRLAGTEVRV